MNEELHMSTFISIITMYGFKTIVRNTVLWRIDINVLQLQQTAFGNVVAMFSIPVLSQIEARMNVSLINCWGRSSLRISTTRPFKQNS